MRLKIRLYRCHDYDLCSLYLAGIDLRGILKTILRAYADGKVYHVQCPVCSLDGADCRSVLTFSITLNPKKDAEAINLIGCVREKQRNAFLKNLLRLYFGTVNQYLSGQAFHMDMPEGVQAFRKTGQPTSTPAPVIEKQAGKRDKEETVPIQTPVPDTAATMQDDPFFGLQKMMDNF